VARRIAGHYDNSKHPVGVLKDERPYVRV